MAEHLNGECVLRFDDTNPEAEKQEYIDHIQDIVSWMGWKPSKASTATTARLQSCFTLKPSLVHKPSAASCFVSHK